MSNWIIRRDLVQTIIENLDLNRMSLKAARNYFSSYGVNVKGRTKQDFCRNLVKLLIEKESEA